MRGESVSDIGLGYGSKWHLLRYLGWHRQALAEAIGRVIHGSEGVDWLDFPFDQAKKPSGDGEWQSLDFLGDEGQEVRNAWRQVWPHGGGIQTWDAVARIRVGPAQEWLLVEAKAHVEELTSNCGAVGRLAMVERALTSTKVTLGVSADRDWLKGYYQYANRIAALHFLTEHKVPAHLLLIYFLGDGFSGRTCPADEAGWSRALDTQAKHLGLPRTHGLAARIHRLFLPVCPR